MKRTLTAFALLAIAGTMPLYGCSEQETATDYYPVHFALPSAPLTEQQTPSGIAVMVPEWLDRFPDLKREAFAEIDGFSAALTGWSVVIREPGSFWTTESETGLARGFVAFDFGEVHVAWRVRPYEDRPLLPALEHEVGHITGGPEAGH